MESGYRFALFCVGELMVSSSGLSLILQQHGEINTDGLIFLHGEPFYLYMDEKNMH